MLKRFIAWLRVQDYEDAKRENTAKVLWLTVLGR